MPGDRVRGPRMRDVGDQVSRFRISNLHALRRSDRQQAAGGVPGNLSRMIADLKFMPSPGGIEPGGIEIDNQN